MIVCKPPHAYDLKAAKHSVFLAGSIEMGLAEDWQQKLTEALHGVDVLILNPRRDDWDSSWQQHVDNPQFRGQVEWELQGLDDASTVVFYFDPATKSPVTLMELGLQAAKSPKKLIVCCPEGFWRKGNVDIVCARYGVVQVASIEALITALESRFK